VSEIEVRSITDQVVERIRDGIRSGEFQAGSDYSVHTFSKVLGVSRTPVREALVRLSEAGMVRFDRNRGITILQPGVRDLEEIFQLRLMVEPLAAGRAARDVPPETLADLRSEIKNMRDAASDDDYTVFMDHDVRFHDIVIGMGGNNRLQAIVSNLRDATRTLGGHPLLQGATTAQQAPVMGLPASLAEVVQEHEPILEAIEAGDSQAAAAAMHKHVKDTGQLLMQQLATTSGRPQDFHPDWADSIPIPSFTSGSGRSPRS
jgi:DNA-binding GntR family transcriptional regulator